MLLQDTGVTLPTLRSIAYGSAEIPGRSCAPRCTGLTDNPRFWPAPDHRIDAGGRLYLAAEQPDVAWAAARP